MTENEDSLPRLLGGRYRLEAKLGSGGMGVVYRATDLTMHRAVAVKLIRGEDGVELDEEVAGRFLREAKNTARVQHENIIEVYDLGRSDQGDMFFVMELLEGESLSAKLRREERLEVEVAVHIARQMCAALHVAHAAGIIHRDLKPANVMLMRRAHDEHYVKVLDFGVSKSYGADQETQLTHTGMLVGTIDYMAPEQIMARTVDGRTDIYALGVLMYRMLTGAAPFRDGGVPALIHAHLNVYPKPMCETWPELPGALDRVVLRCLAKQPEQRYESMEEVSRALASAIEPPSLRIPDLAFREGDEDEAAEKTQAARPSAHAPRLPPESELADEVDDATIKMDRIEIAALRAFRAPVDRSGDLTSVMPRLEAPRGQPRGARRGPEAVSRHDSSASRDCAMCHTQNAPHARACSACGVSLASQDQAAVRARVTAPRASQMPPPPMAPSMSGAYPAPGGAPPFGHPAAHGAKSVGAQGMPGQGMPGQGMPGQGMPAHGVPGQGMLGQGMPGQGMPAHGGPGHGMPGQGMPAHGAPGQGMMHGGPGQAMPGHGVPGQGVPGHGMPGHGMPGQGQGVPGQGQGVPGHGMPGHAGVRPQQGSHAGMPSPSNMSSGAWGAMPPSVPPAAPPSAWQRFLTWTGLRGR